MLLLEPRHIYAADLTQRLRAHEFAVEVVHSEAAALDELRNGDPDVVMVCIGTDGPGAAVLDRVRQTSHVGVVAVTDADVRPLLSNVALTSERKIEGLNTRIRSVLRHNRIGTQTAHRGWNGEATRPRKIADLEVDVVSRRVFMCGNTVAVTRIEFAILDALSACPGEPVTSRQLAEFVWGSSVTGGRSALGVHVGRLRRKLGEDSASPRYLRTVRGVGYSLGG